MRKKTQRKRLLTQLYESLDQLDTLMVDSARKPSALKACVTKCEILAALLKRDDEIKAAKIAAKAATTTPPPAPENLSAEELIERVQELKQRKEGEK